MKKSRMLVIAVIIIILAIIVGAIAGIIYANKYEEDNDDEVKTKSSRKVKDDDDKNKDENKDTQKKSTKVKKTNQVNIIPSETENIKYETFDNGLVSFEYPKGWKVEVAPTDYIHYAFKAYNPSNPTYMFLFNLKQEGALKTEKARQVYENYYPDAPFAKIAAIDPQTTEGYYNAYPHNSQYANESINVDFFPEVNDFEVIENLGQDLVGGDILRAKFTDSNGKAAQGIFTAAVKDIGSYYISEDIFNPFGAQVDVAPLNTYNIMIMSAPEEDFINWQEILDHCLASVEFTQTFVNGFNSEETTLTQTIIANQKVYDQISDMIMDSWEKRNNSYDIISQKQSDATLGYERVYDTDTGEIYKAYNGFTDDYTGDRYQPITDNMYTEATSGYIDKIY